MERVDDESGSTVTVRLSQTRSVSARFEAGHPLLAKGGDELEAAVLNRIQASVQDRLRALGDRDGARWRNPTPRP